MGFLVQRGRDLLLECEDAAILRTVHRRDDEAKGIPPEEKEEYLKELERFMDVTGKLADANWTEDDRLWLAKLCNRSRLEKSEAGRKRLREIDANAPLLVDGRRARGNDPDVADILNARRQEDFARSAGTPIVQLCALHTKRDKRLKPELMDPDEFRGLVSVLALCEGARVLLTQNLWVEAGLMNGSRFDGPRRRPHVARGWASRSRRPDAEQGALRHR